jgi:hypothetical protein
MARAPWYDPNDPAQMHEDLRTNYAAATEIIGRRPSTQKHFDTCPDCRAVREAQNNAPSPLATRKRLKVRITAALMHQLLKLPASHEIVIMYSEPDPNAVYVILAGEDLPAVAEGDPTPVAGQGLPDAA